MLEFEEDSGLRFGDTLNQLQQRKRMIQEQIISRGIKDPRVLCALEVVPRHRFVDESMERSAYEDSPLPIAENQTISQPFIVAYMTEALELQGEEKVLEVGAGSGYQAAILAEIVTQVYTIEINENLAIEVALRLKKMGYRNVMLKCDDGYQGWPEHAPFDCIVVTAAPNHIPQALLEQLKPGGRMVIPVGETDQELILVRKQWDGSIKKEPRIPVRFVPMIRAAEKKD